MMEFVNGTDDIPYMKWKKHVRNHQPNIIWLIYIYIYISFFKSLVKIFLLSSVRVVTSDMNGGMNVCVNDMRASERTCERMYVRVSVRASERVSVHPCVCTVTRHGRAHVRK